MGIWVSRLLGRAVVVDAHPCPNPCSPGSRSELFHNCQDLAACDAFIVTLDRWVDGIGPDSYCQVGQGGNLFPAKVFMKQDSMCICMWAESEHIYPMQP